MQIVNVIVTNNVSDSNISRRDVSSPASGLARAQADWRDCKARPPPLICISAQLSRDALTIRSIGQPGNRQFRRVQRGHAVLSAIPGAHRISGANTTTAEKAPPWQARSGAVTAEDAQNW